MDTLTRLDAARKALAHHRLTSPRAFSEASAEVRRDLGANLAYAEHVIRERDPVLLRLLFWDAEREGVDWDVCRFGMTGHDLGVTLSFRRAGRGEARVLALLRSLADEGPP